MTELQRLYQITVTRDDKHIAHWITTSDVLAAEQFNALQKLNTEDRIGLYSDQNHCESFNYLHQII